MTELQKMGRVLDEAGVPEFLEKRAADWQTITDNTNRALMKISAENRRERRDALILVGLVALWVATAVAFGLKVAGVLR